MQEISDQELQSLISLLDENDEDILTQINKKILSYGVKAIPFLENAWENTHDANFHTRIENNINIIRFDNTYIRLKNWMHLGSNNLIQGYNIVTAYQYPELEKEIINAKIKGIAKDAWLELNDNLTALEKINILNHIIYKIYGFKGGKGKSKHLHDYFINNVIESKTGNPLSLSIIYAAIAQQLEIPITGISLPNHFVLAYYEDKSEIAGYYTIDDHILFFINPFKDGAVFSHKEIDLFIRQLDLNPNKNHIKVCNNADIIHLLIIELMHSYKNIGKTIKANDMKKLLDLF